MRKKIVFYAFVMFSLPNIGAAIADPCFTDTKGNTYCYPYRCLEITQMSTADDYSLKQHLNNTKQRSAFSEAQRKCFFKSAGDATRDAAESVTKSGKSLLDKSGVGEFFKSLTD